MRRSTSTTIRGTVLVLLLAPASGAQDPLGPGSGVFVRPPAEVGPPASSMSIPMAVHPAPPAPTVPPPSPSIPIGMTSRPDGPMLAIDPTGLASPGRVPPSAPEPGRPVGPFQGILPAVSGDPAGSSTIEGPPSVQVRPPLGASSTAIDPETLLGEGPLVLSPSIAPPLSAGDEAGPAANPLLPPGPGGDRRGRDEDEDDQDEDEDDDRERRSRRASSPTSPDRGRPGLFGGVLDRLFGPPSPPQLASGRLPGNRGAGTAGHGIGIPDDPAFEEAIRRDLERRIAARAGDRISSVEVLIVGGRVHIRAEASRFWQRRPLKRDLEGIPMPSGFRSSVEVR